MMRPRKEAPESQGPKTRRPERDATNNVGDPEEEERKGDGEKEKNEETDGAKGGTGRDGEMRMSEKFGRREEDDEAMKNTTNTFN